MYDDPLLSKFVGKRSKLAYKPAKTKGKGSYSSSSGYTKPAQKDNVAKKVKRISNKIMKFKTKNPGPASNSTYGGNNA